MCLSLGIAARVRGSELTRSQGEQLARLEMRLFLVRLVQSYECRVLHRELRTAFMMRHEIEFRVVRRGA